eukprot:12183365-Prorocentrum_lima.AAC.1
MGELHEHRRRGRHTQLNLSTAAGGELSIDLAGPHVSAPMPKDLAREPKGRCALVATYAPLKE